MTEGSVLCRESDLCFLLILKFLFRRVSSAAHQRGGLVAVWAVPGSRQRGGFTERVGREQQAVCGKVHKLKTVSRTVSNVYYAVWNGRLKAEQSSNGRRSLQLKLSRLCCRQKHEKGFTVCCLAWHPSGSQIAYTDTEGRLGLLDGLGTSNTDTTKVLLRQHSIQTLLLTQL